MYANDTNLLVPVAQSLATPIHYQSYVLYVQDSNPGADKLDSGSAQWGR